MRNSVFFSVGMLVVEVLDDELLLVDVELDDALAGYTGDTEGANTLRKVNVDDSGFSGGLTIGAEAVAEAFAVPVAAPETVVLFVVVTAVGLAA